MILLLVVYHSLQTLPIDEVHEEHSHYYLAKNLLQSIIIYYQIVFKYNQTFAISIYDRTNMNNDNQSESKGTKRK